MKMNTLSFEQDGYIGTLTINRPEALNALNTEVLKELITFITHVQQIKDLRVLLVTGSGTKAFVAGADIKEMAAMNAVEAREFAELGQRAFNGFTQLPFAVIATVNGFALGGGCELALACDIIIASEKAQFGLPETTLGLLPCFGGTQRLARAVGLFKAREMIFSGNFYSAETALKMGMINSISPAENLLGSALKLAATIASRGPIAIGSAKKVINNGYELPLDEGLKAEAIAFGALFQTSDQKEGTSAFIEKRTPLFQGS